MKGLIRSIFYYLDRAHILANPKLSSITYVTYNTELTTVTWAADSFAKAFSLKSEH